jgi:glycosyltransferase involved in cell wall biosynthesis
VRVLKLEHNLGFGGGSNAGFRAAKNGIVALLNNDMRVEPNFLPPLLRGFADPRVFAVSSQIFFSDPAKRREETGVTQGEWINGRLHVRQLIDHQINDLFPVFYAGGGSTAYDRRKFLDLGGFDPLMEPFYLEDTDVSYMAWKRGWVILYQPESIVYHDHRGTIGTHFSSAYIEAVLQKNHLLFTWKNIHERKRLAAHFFWLYAGMWVHLLAGPSPTRPTLGGFLRALRQFGGALRSRQRARQLSQIDDTEAFRRPLGGYFRDRFMTFDPEREKLNVLFVSPYPIEPPLHGGAVFMNQTIRNLVDHANVHLMCLLDEAEDYETNQRLETVCASAEFMVRWKNGTRGIGALDPHAARTFYSADFLWRIHRAIYQRRIDVVQVDYTQLAVYAPFFHQIATFLFEHDIYFQSVLRGMKVLRSPVPWMHSGFEYLRALRFERRALSKFDAVQVCTAENRRYLESFCWNGTPIREGLRAGIEIGQYRFVEHGREADTMLFVGNFRHEPNREALEFFVQRVLPLVCSAKPHARLVIVGAHAPPEYGKVFQRPDIEYLGTVQDIRQVLEKHAVFVCPVLSGSGVRVKLLEAFAAGIPVVSTPVGAEGLAGENPDHIELAESAEEFAQKLVALLSDPERARSMARRARQEVETEWDISRMTGRLEEYYRSIVRKKVRKFEAERPEPFRFAPRDGARQEQTQHAAVSDTGT